MNDTKLTLLCLTFNRHSYLESSLKYWSKTNFIVIVADGSDVPFKSSILNANNIFYYHVKTGINERGLFLLDHIKTPYACLITDDDSYLPSAFEKCIKFLEENDEYVCAVGRAIGFKTYKNNIFFNQIYSLFYKKHLLNDSAYLRLIEHFKNFTPSHCHSVIRSDTFIESFRPAFNPEVDVYALAEIVNEFIVICKGKSIVLPYLHWLRSYNATPIRNTGDIGLNTNLLFEEWWQKKEFENQRQNFCRNLSVLSNLIVNEDQIKDIFDCYVYKNNLKLKIVGIIKNILNESSKQKFRKLNNFINKFKKDLFNSENINKKVFSKLESQGVYINYKELELFKKSIKI